MDPSQRSHPFLVVMEVADHMVVAKPCLTCRKPTTRGSYCKAHQKRANPRYADNEYVRNRARLLQHHRQTYGDICPGDRQHPPHRTNDLTVDHIVPLNNGGTHDITNLRVICRSSNSSKGARG